MPSDPRSTLGALVGRLRASQRRHHVVARLGQGATASVFLGRRTDDPTGPFVAIKRYHPHLLADAAARDAFVAHAERAARVRHRNVVAILEVDRSESEPVLVLEYVEGATLAELVEGGDTAGAARPLARIAVDVARGLHAAHAEGVVHGDVAPQNVLVGVDGVARIADFSVPLDGVPWGRKDLGAPEVLAGGAPNAGSDQFSLARALVALDGWAPAVRSVFSRASESAPRARFASCEAFAEALEAVGAHRVASPAEVAAWVEARRGDELARRRQAIAAALEAERLAGTIPLGGSSKVPSVV